MLKDIKKYHKLLVIFFLMLLAIAIGCRIVKSRIYHSDTGINLVVVGEDEVAVVGVTNKEESLVWVDLPDNLRVDGYPARSLWGLGEIEGESEDMVKTSLGDNLGLWVHASIKVEGDVSVESLLKRLLSLKRIENINWIDRYVLYKDISSLTSKGVVLELNLPYQVTEKVQDVDGYEWLELNEAVFVWSRDLWPKEEVMNLGITAEVINVSGEPGKARKKARQLESVGFRVVSVEAGSNDIQSECLVKVGQQMEEKKELLQRVFESYLNCDVETFDEGDEFFGDVVFFVGS